MDRISVEWLFGDVINYFKFFDFKKNLKIGQVVFENVRSLQNSFLKYVVCIFCKMYRQFCMGTQLQTIFRKSLQV